MQENRIHGRRGRRILSVMVTGLVALLAFLTGVVIAIMAAQYWQKRKWLYIVPFVYAFIGEIALSVNQGRAIDSVAALFFGAVFWGLAVLAKAMYEQD